MFNGLSPLLVFYLPRGEHNSLPAVIPLYLDPKRTGLYLEDDSKELNISNDAVLDVTDKNRMTLVQKGLTNSVDFVLKGRADSTGLNILLMLTDQIYDLIMKKKDYKIAYINRNILLFNSKLSNFKIEPESNTNLVRIAVGLQYEEKEADKKEDKSVEKLDNAEGTDTGPLTEGD